ncbi:MAG: nicotinate dehydrogenase subunit A [Gammaproteobacteria bacterium]|jgi:nicotinate dehydrogenase subunit A
MSDRQPVVLNVNARQHTLRVEPSTPLLFVLRNHLGLTAAKFGCGLEQCGACAVLVDGASVLSCSTPVAAFVGCEIVTCEGLGQSESLSPVQQAFAEESTGQCGYCIPGLVVATTALLNANREPDSEQIAQALLPHLCRCGSHTRVLKAIDRAVGRGRESATAGTSGTDSAEVNAAAENFR